MGSVEQIMDNILPEVQWALVSEGKFSQTSILLPLF